MTMGTMSRDADRVAPALEHRIPSRRVSPFTSSAAAETPDAVPFVLVHGLASNLQLVGRRGRAAPRARPHGDRARPAGPWPSDAPEAGYDLDTAVADLLALIDALGLERPVLAGQSWGGNVVLELAWRRPDALRGVACVDGGIIELAEWYPTWEACLAALTPPSLDHLTMAELRARLRQSNPAFPEGALAAYEHCFRVRPDGTIEPRLARHRHLQILRSLWEHRPSRRYATLTHAGDAAARRHRGRRRTAAKRQAEAAALASGGKIRSRWFAPGHHDLHLQFPERGDGRSRGSRAGRILRVSARAPRLLTLMGSGETAPTMVTTHREVVARFGDAAPPRRPARHAVWLPGERRGDHPAGHRVLRPPRAAGHRGRPGSWDPSPPIPGSARPLPRPRPSRACARPT